MIAPISQLLAGLFSLSGIDVDEGVITELITGLVMFAAAAYQIFLSYNAKYR